MAKTRITKAKAKKLVKAAKAREAKKSPNQKRRDLVNALKRAEAAAHKAWIKRDKAEQACDAAVEAHEQANELVWRAEDALAQHDESNYDDWPVINMPSDKLNWS